MTPVSGAHPRFSDAESDSKYASRGSILPRSDAPGSDGRLRDRQRIEHRRNDVDVAHVRRLRRDACTPGARTISGILSVASYAKRPCVSSPWSPQPFAVIGGDDDERVRIGVDDRRELRVERVIDRRDFAEVRIGGVLRTRTARADGTARARRRDAPTESAACLRSRATTSRAASSTAPAGRS